MKDIIQTHRDSVKKKSRGLKTSPDVVPARRRSLSDGGDSDAPPVLTLTIPSSEELGKSVTMLTSFIVSVFCYIISYQIISYHVIS